MNEQRVARQFPLYKPIAKALKMAAAEESFGEGLTQADIVNLILAKELGINLAEIRNGDVDGEDERGDKLSRIAELAGYSVVEPMTEVVKEPFIADAPTVDLFLVLLSEPSATFSSLARANFDLEKEADKIAAYKEAVMKRCEEVGQEFKD